MLKGIWKSAPRLRWLILLIITCVFAPSARAESTISVNFILGYGTNQELPAANGYYAFPELQILPDPRSTATELQSPGFIFYSSVDAGENFSTSQSTIIAHFDDFKEALDAPNWFVRLDAFTPTPTDYFFDVDASALQNFALTPVTIAAGIQGASFAEGSQPTFMWSGPSGFDSISFSLLRSDLTTIEAVNLDPTTTSHTIGVHLAPGSYQLDILYTLDLTASQPISLSTPTNAGQPLADWGGVAHFTEQIDDFVSFTVVPEPGSLILFGTAILLAVARKAQKLIF